MRLPSTTKEAVRRRAWNQCEYCHSRERFSPTAFSVEHIIPRCGGGGDDSDNLALSCQECNNRKYTAIGARDPLNGGLVPLFHPRRHLWSDHFTWNEDFTLIVGLTPTGRSTIDKLQMKRPALVSLRRLLSLAGLTPLHDRPDV